MVVGSSVVTVTYTSDMVLVLSKQSLDIYANIVYGFTLKHVHDIRRKYSLMHRTDNYSQFSSIVWSLEPNG